MLEFLVVIKKYVKSNNRIKLIMLSNLNSAPIEKMAKQLTKEPNAVKKEEPEVIEIPIPFDSKLDIKD